MLPFDSYLPGTAGDPAMLWQFLDGVTGVAAGGLENIWQRHLRSGEPLESLLTGAGVIDDSLLAHLYSEHYLLPMFDPPEGAQPPVDRRIATLLDAEFCFTRMIAPLADDGTTIDVGIVSPDAFQFKAEIQQRTGRQMRMLFAPLSVVRRVLEVLYPGASDRLEPRVEAASAGVCPASLGLTEPVAFEPLTPTELPRRHDRPALEEEDSPEAKNYLHALLERALERRATEVHLEPYQGHCRVRLRIQGTLTEVAPPGPLLVPGVLAYLRRLARLERDADGLPQEGTIRVRHGRRRVLVPVHTLPTIDGDKFLLGIVSRATTPPRLRELGMGPLQQAQLADALHSGQGMVLVTGPRHSGKRWTLYGCMDWLNTAERNLYAVEDAARLHLPGVNQVPARPEAGLGIGAAVRTLLRQQPDALMVSEIADAETARACADAADQGALVVAAVHADSPAEGFARLLDWGLEPHTLDRQLRLMLSQRRMRRLCGGCRGQRSAAAAAPELAATCGPCRGRGYRGQLVVFDIVAPESDGGLARWSNSSHLLADSQHSLERKLEERVRSGLTSADEVARVLKRW